MDTRPVTAPDPNYLAEYVEAELAAARISAALDVAGLTLPERNCWDDD